MLRKIFTNRSLSPEERRLREFCQKRPAWAKRSPKAPVILVSLYDVPSSIVSTALAGNLLADAFGARLGAFCFETPSKRLMSLYKDIGAPLVLQSGNDAELEKQAEKAADELLARCGTKQELVDAVYKDLLIGDVIYDSYLRHEAKATVDFADPALRHVTTKIFESLFLCERFFAENEVVAVIPDHVVYLRGGAISRFAASRGIPVLLPAMRKEFTFRLAAQVDAGHGQKALYNFDFEHFPEIFAALSPSEQATAREAARARLDMILRGTATPVPGMASPYAAPSPERVLPDTGRPRMLIMLHEFCDAPHCLGHMLYPDFYEWILDTLEEASRTEFDWFVKPHACILMKGRNRINDTNREVVEELQRKFPKVTFLPPNTSNRQLLQDGVTAMFTLHGSAGYEFTYEGVPVVTAGNTHYRRYDFTTNPDTVEEYRSWIRNADKVPFKGDQKKIEEFYFTLLSQTSVGTGDGAPFYPASVFQPGFDTSALMSPAIYDVVLDAFTPEVEQGLREHFQNFAARQHSPA